jgi:hypothetical protein
MDRAALLDIGAAKTDGPERASDPGIGMKNFQGMQMEFHEIVV